jgi:hypothetical protein
VGQGFLIIEDLLSHTDALQSVGLLWTSDQPDAETSTGQYTTLTRRQTSTPPPGFEHTIPVSERAQTQATEILESV